MEKVVADLRRKGKVVRNVWTGFESQAVDARVARYFGLSQVEGIIVSDIYRNSPAERAGVKVGDIILEVNGEKVSSEDQLFGLLGDASAGDILKLKIYRERKMIDLQLRLEQKS